MWLEALGPKKSQKGNQLLHRIAPLQNCGKQLTQNHDLDVTVKGSADKFQATELAAVRKKEPIAMKH